MRRGLGATLLLACGVGSVAAVLQACGDSPDHGPIPPARAAAVPAPSGPARGPGGEPTADPQASYLTPEQRVHLFDLERADLLLGKALSGWTGALKKGDEAAAREALSAGFGTRVPEFPAGFERAREAGRAIGHLRVDATREGGAAEFLAWWSDLRARFERVDTVFFGRTRNGVEILEGPAATARSEGLFRFAGPRAGGGLLEVTGEFTLDHAGMAPDGRPGPGWVRGLALSRCVAVHADAPLFDEVTGTCGIDVASLHDNWRDRDTKGSKVITGGCYLGDVDLDGHLDLLVTDLWTARLWLGDGRGSFRDAGWRSPRSAPHAAIFDATGDGKPEVLLGGRLWVWGGAASGLVPIESTPLPAGDVSLCDYDRDGRTDVYLLNAGRRAEDADRRAFFDDDRRTGAENLLFRNLGGGRFEDVTARTNASGGMGRTFAATWFYADDDLWPDVFGANEFGRNAFLGNRGGVRFQDLPDVDPVFGGFSMGVASGDLDDDGRCDLYVSNMYSKAGHRVYHHLDLARYPPNVRRMFMASISGNRAYRSRGDLGFDEMKDADVHVVGWAWGGALADFDLDGRLDVYAPCGHTSVDRSKADG